MARGYLALILGNCLIGTVLAYKNLIKNKNNILFVSVSLGSLFYIMKKAGLLQKVHTLQGGAEGVLEVFGIITL